MLFSMKNQILEMTLNKSDFQFLTTTNYDVKPTFFINLPSKAVQIERERNIEYCELYFLNIFGEKIPKINPPNNKVVCNQSPECLLYLYLVALLHKLVAKTLSILISPITHSYE